MLEADIDLLQLRGNINIIKSDLKASKLCLVVKADAYGHGMPAIACNAVDLVDEFAVATLEEAIALQSLKLNKPIVLLENVDISHLNINTMPDIIPVICQFSDIKWLPKGIKRVNIKFNSGMNRLGTNLTDFDKAITELLNKGVYIHSLFSHFYDGKNQTESKKQLDRFLQATSQQLENHKNIKQTSLHIAASSSVELGYNNCFLDMVRCGILAYGYPAKTKPIMQIHTDILQVLDVAEGEHIGYGDFVANKDSRVAIIRIGYADGYRRRNNQLTDERHVAIEGTLCKVLGQVCMDLTAVDVSSVKMKSTSRAYILGGGVKGESLAESCNTIIYEILTSFNKERMKKNYIFKAN